MIGQPIKHEERFVMRDLSFQEALDDPEMPFRRFVAACTELWNRAVVIYEAAGSPNSPAMEGNNVSSCFEDTWTPQKRSKPSTSC